jgi:hypothetical protein
MKILIIFLLTASTVMAMPKKLEVWFLSVDKTAFLEPLIKKTHYTKKVATNYQCQKMGEYCFDPQIGLYKKEKGKLIEATDYSSLDSQDTKVAEGSYQVGAYDPCEKSSHFSLFCKNIKSNKKKLIKPSEKLEVWVDISTTMKQVDFKGYEQACRRETFLRRVNKSCPLNKKMKVFIFDENRKELGNFDRVCLSSGLNRLDRLMRDIKESTAKNLIIITDIYEAKSNFIDFIEGDAAGIVKGIEKPIYAKDLLKDVSRIQKMCQ